MLKSKLITALIVTVSVLTMVQENEVEAAPEPCRGLFKSPKHEKKPEEDEKEKEKRKENEKKKKLQKFLEDLFNLKD